MSTDLVPVTFANPVTGEALTLESPDAELGRYLVDVRDVEGQIRDVKNAVQRELLSRFDKAASWTVHAPGLKLSAPSPKPAEEFDGPALREALLTLVDEGVLSIEAVDAAVETVVSYEPRKRGINALRSLGGRAKAIVDAHATEIEKARYVRIERSA